MSLPHRPSLHPSALHQHAQPGSNASSASAAAAQNRQRQYSHLHAQLAQLNAHLADMENLLRMTAVQAEYVRGLGGWMGGLFMASSKILGEETVAGSAAAAAAAATGATGTQTAPAPAANKEVEPEEEEAESE